MTWGRTEQKLRLREGFKCGYGERQSPDFSPSEIWQESDVAMKRRRVRGLLAQCGEAGLDKTGEWNSPRNNPELQELQSGPREQKQIGQLSLVCPSSLFSQERKRRDVTCKILGNTA